MDQKPKLETVARRASVSVATVSQVMRGTGRISEQTRKKVLRSAAELHYVPDGRAAAMRSGQNYEVGFVINQISNPFNAEVISGVSDLLEMEGFLVSVLDAGDDPKRQRKHIEAFIRHGRGGLLWVPAIETSKATLDLLAVHQIPTVTFLRYLEERSFDHIGIRNFEATYTATLHLINLGHKHIAYLGGTDMSRVRYDRVAGCKKAITDSNLDGPVIWDCHDTKLAGMNAMNILRKTHPEITAIMCNGDMVALGACHTIIRAGEYPGREISIIGFDDISDAAIATPALTTMAVSPYHLGRRLARTLLDRIKEPASPITISEVSAQLVERETTGQAPIN